MRFQFSETLELSNLPPVSAFTVTAGGNTITNAVPVSGVSPRPGSPDVFLITVSPAIRQGQAIVVTYTDPTAGDDATAFQDVAGNDAASFTTGSDGVPAVTNASTVVPATTATEVPAGWNLKPTSLTTGDKFRLLFLSSTKRDGSSTDIATYNTFVQGRAAAGHADIRTYSAGFRAVGCTADTDARDNTSTTYTATDKGVPIYWLDGAKAADEYEDFYDGSWDDEVNDKNESGTDGPDTSLVSNYPLTGCGDDGTEAFFNTSSRALGASGAVVRVGRPNSSITGNGPINSIHNAASTDIRPMYGLSAVFQVAVAVNTPAAGAPAITAPNVFRVPAVLGVDLSGITDTDGVTNIATNATYKWQRFNAAGTTLDTDNIGTNATYKLTDTDATKTLKVVVNFTDDASNSEGPLTSAATSAIIAAATDCNAPTYIGGATQLGPARKVGVESFGSFPGTGFSVPHSAGSLDNPTFTTTSSNTHEIVGIVTLQNIVLVALTRPSRPTDQGRSSCIVCDQAYAFGSEDLRSDYSFTTSPRSWSTHAERTIYLSQDTAAPTFASATVNGTSLVITLSEPLGAAASLANSAFTVKKGPSGSQTTLTLSGTAPVISGSTVTLTLASAVTASDTNVLVTYDTPTSGTANKLVDAFGNETGTFADQVVTNLLSTTVPSAPSGLSATASGTPRSPAPQVGQTLDRLDRWQPTWTACPARSPHQALRRQRDHRLQDRGVDRPRRLQQQPAGTRQINLSWTAPASTGGSAITGYKIEVSSNGGSSWTDQVANTGSTTTTYAHTGLAPGSTRHYRVSAINTNGSGTASNVDSATTGQTTVTFATLSALTVSPKDIIGFVADRTSYEVGVASTVTQATITATKSHSAATVAYSTTDADTSAGHQVNLSDGRNEVTITVTAEDTTTTGTYTVSINRGVTAIFGWKASDDFDGLITAENNLPLGMWSDGTTMWVTDWIDIKIYAYNLTTKARDASKDFDTLDAAGNDNPRGIWSDGTTMWVVDYSDEKLYAYDMTTKARDVSKDFDTANLLPTGIWSDGTTMWVTVQIPTKIYAYDMTTKARDAGKDFDTLRAAGNNYPRGIWSNNITMWVSDLRDAKLYAYNMASKARDADKDFNTLSSAGNGGARGIWANTNTMWASDPTDDKIYSYNMPLIAPNTPAAGLPAITAPNVFRVPAVLTADLSGITDTDGVTGIATTAIYKWQRFAANGTTLDTDSIGTGSTYTLSDADAGKTLKVVVSFTDNGGNSEGPLTSAATAAITAAAICAAPTLTGGAVFLGSARKVVVGEFNLGSHSYWGFNKAEDAGSLDNATFTTGDPNNYEILVAATRSREDWLLVLDAAFPANVQRTLAVHFCDEDIALGSVTPVLSNGNYYYTSDTLLQNWASHTERTIYLSQDTAAPTFASATVNGTSLVITLSESLGAAASLANSAFTVKKNGSATRLTMSATAPLISGSTVTLTLAAASSVSATDTNVLVTYTKPGTGTANKLVDAFGNETATFEDEVVANVTPAATAPTAADGTVTTNEDTEHTFAAANFNYATGNTDPLASVKITGLPATGKGTLSLNGTAIASTALPQTVTATELTANKLKYSPPANENGMSYASFTFKVNDGTADSADYTMTINVTAVNDPATGAPTISGTAQVGQTLTASIADIADLDGLPGTFTYQWKRYAANGTTFEANIGANSSTYTLTASEEGKKVLVEVSFTDNGGNSEGPLISALYPSTQSQTVDANNPPTAADGTVTTVEDTVHTFAAANFSYSDTDNDPLVSVKITGPASRWHADAERHGNRLG